MHKYVTLVTKALIPHLPILFILPLLILTTSYSYLFFHITIEIVSLLIALAVFIFIWNERHLIQNHYFIFLGIAFLSVAFIDYFHTLSYKGMGVFNGIDSNIPTSLWIAGRYLLSISFILAPLFINRKIHIKTTLIIYLVLSVLIILSIFRWHIFPLTYIDGIGLTPFKKSSEYIIALLFFASFYNLFRLRSHFDRYVFVMLIFATVSGILSDIFFTLYVGVYDIFNQTGHILKLLSYYFIYKAILEVGLRQPYQLLFLELKRSQQQKDDFLNLSGHELKIPLPPSKPTPRS